MASTLLRNIELKARCRDLAAATAAALTLSPRDTGSMRQIDTYFHVPHGRLKLREIVGVKSELIWYDRADAAVSRQSEYRLTPITHPEELRTSLAAAMGISVEVRKVRHVLLWHNVRIHLDEVDGLGSFVEFEAVMTDGEDEPTAHARLAELCRVMSIAREDYLDVSYSQMK
jgi:predicted adenylyl cyclase CyaB